MLPLILIGGLAPLAAAYSLGKLCFPCVPDVLALAAGAVLESVAIFCLAMAGFATLPVFIAFTALTCVPLLRLRPRPRFPLPRHPVLMAIFAGYGLFYFVHALAPEIQPDAVFYHLGLVAEYAPLGGFSRHIDFYSMLPEGMEMLFLYAFQIGRHSAAKLVEFGFLLATIPLTLEIGRRLGLKDHVSGAGAALYFCAPVVGFTGTSTYTDAALVFFTLATLLALLLWRRNSDAHHLIAAGLVSGFCYAVKMNGALVPVLAMGFVLLSRRWRSAITLAAAAAIPVVPWLARNAILTGNPFAPLANGLFPNPYFHVMGSGLTTFRSMYPQFTYRAAPWDLAVGDRLQGTFGPVFLLLPVGLLALRQRIGRWIWLAGLLAALPWALNAGARFLMPAAPFLALALAMSLDTLSRPLLWLCVTLHAVASLPEVSIHYQSPWALRLPPLPWRAALRIESEENYLTRSVWAYPIATRLLPEHTRPGETTFTLIDLPHAYKNRPLLDTWESAQARRFTDALMTADRYFDLRAEWPLGPLHGLRFRVPEAGADEWDVNEIRLYSGPDRVYNSPQWTLRAWPNPWESPLAFDDNFASRWRTWQPVPAGSFIEVLFDRPQRLTSAVLGTHTPALSRLRLEIYGLRADGRWKLLSRDPSQALHAADFRREAARFVKRQGVSYILAPTEEPGAWQLGRILVERQKEFGLEEVAQDGAIHLLRIQP